VGHGLAEPSAPVLAELVKSGAFTHLIGPHSATGKNIFPRVAALLDVAQISDVMRIDAPDTFVRPIYAGNAIATVKSHDAIKVFTVRTASFNPVQASGPGAAVEEASVSSASAAGTEWLSESLTKSERPELGSAKRIVSGGRGVKNKENFDSIMTPLADALGAAIGASRAAVDSGFADNSLRVNFLVAVDWLMFGTGKSVRPARSLHRNYTLRSVSLARSSI
jgi:electron transfer flavoprotein alpha subunit